MEGYSFAPGERGGVPVDPRDAVTGSPLGNLIKSVYWLLTGKSLPKENVPRDIDATKPQILKKDGATVPVTPENLEKDRQERKQDQPQRSPDRSSFCFGMEQSLCGGVELFGSSKACEAGANLVCLTIGLFILLALLSLSVNALLRG